MVLLPDDTVIETRQTWDYKGYGHDTGWRLLEVA